MKLGKLVDSFLNNFIAFVSVSKDLQLENISDFSSEDEDNPGKCQQSGWIQWEGISGNTCVARATWETGERRYEIRQRNYMCVKI